MGTTYEDTEHHVLCGCHLHDTNKDISLVSFIHSFILAEYWENNLETENYDCKIKLEHDFATSISLMTSILFFSKIKAMWPSEYHDKWVPVTTAWRVLRLRMEERPPDMEGSCEYIE